MAEFDPRVGKAIKELRVRLSTREGAEISQPRLAELIGLNEHSINSYESRTGPSERALRILWRFAVGEKFADIADVFRKAIAEKLDPETLEIAQGIILSEKTVLTGTKEPIEGEREPRKIDRKPGELYKMLRDIMESGHHGAMEAISQNIAAFHDLVRLAREKELWKRTRTTVDRAAAEAGKLAEGIRRNEAEVGGRAGGGSDNRGGAGSRKRAPRGGEGAA